jgi:hypothetical protein
MANVRGEGGWGEGGREGGRVGGWEGGRGKDLGAREGEERVQ